MMFSGPSKRLNSSINEEAIYSIAPSFALLVSVLIVD